MKETDGPIVAAVREARRKIIAECDYDLRRLHERLEKIDAEHADQVCPPRRRSRGPTRIRRDQ